MRIRKHHGGSTASSTDGVTPDQQPISIIAGGSGTPAVNLQHNVGRLAGGFVGSMAVAVQAITLMLTLTNWQYRHGHG